MAPTARDWCSSTSCRLPTTRSGASFGPGAVGMGWDSMLLGLALHLATGEAVDPSFGQQWTGTDDGRRFLTLSGDEWYAANVDFGTDPAAARAMADRCVKAYLGEEQN